jgi:RNA polymerase sigma-70 factor (ECF subfamily)
VIQFLRGREFPPPVAEDIAQDVFETILKSNLLQRADKAKGRFRCLMIAVIRHVLADRRKREAAQKRGGGVRTESLDAPVGDEGATLAEFVGARDNDDDFDRQWVKDLLDRAMEGLRNRGSGYQSAYKALVLSLDPTTTYAGIATTLGVSIGTVKNMTFEARKWLKEEFDKLIRRYCSSREEYEEEVLYLERFIR